MAEVVNLRTRRKQAARDMARDKGSEAAARHGQSRAQKNLTAAQTEKARRDLDGHRRETGEGQDPA